MKSAIPNGPLLSFGTFFSFISISLTDTSTSRFVPRVRYRYISRDKKLYTFSLVKIINKILLNSLYLRIHVINYIFLYIF